LGQAGSETVVDAIDEREDLGHGAVQLLRDIRVQVELGQNRDQVRIFVNMNPMFTRNRDDLFGKEPGALGDNARRRIGFGVVP